jgi:hypothetical protein
MFSRRDFMKTAAVSTAIAQIAEPAIARFEEPWRPVRAEPRKRTIFARPHRDDQFRLYTDGAPEPRPLIRQEALERAFGKGAGQGLLQPDHWHMIELGWFVDDDLFVPSEPGSWEFAVWQANYHPECEAHDLLMEFCSSAAFLGGGALKELGLALAEHPCTPRFATATLIRADFLPIVARAVADRSEWITIRPAPLL